MMIDREAFAGLTMTESLLTCLTLLHVVLLAQVKVSRSIILLISCLVLLEAASRRWLRTWLSSSSWLFVQFLCYESFLWVNLCLITLSISSASHTSLVYGWRPCCICKCCLRSWMCDWFLMRAGLTSFGLVSAWMMVCRLDRWVMLFTTFMRVASRVWLFFLWAFLF